MKRLQDSKESQSYFKNEQQHSQVEYAVEDCKNLQHLFKRFDDAAAFAVGIALSGKTVFLDVLIYTIEGAEWYGGEDAKKQFDPETSVFERLEIQVNSKGMIP